MLDVCLYHLADWDYNFSMSKSIITIIIVAVVLIGGYFLFRGAYQPKPSVTQPSNQQTAPQSSMGQMPVAEKNVVTYADTDYLPATLQVKKGETVTFKNQSPQSMWTASAVHPTHRGYPTTGGCLGSTFDACKGVQSGDSWSFKFDIVGTWKYHNHLSPSNTGTIYVSN